ncbi:hypothetical protein M408DRAFT_331626 [Serendipita vermifera MAFF 305830]|uniref:Uncharacterized protein n=1 Tax=Serendipita vermifera MAFF 305830 TaxID=933852 RepID=A0A0C2X695_SERVB|nr:hypothetical protein M408DRAFT_331626 [Serendipita vermifera MAFF 305830]
MVGPKKTFFSGSTGNFTDLAAKRNPLSVTKDLTGQSRTVMEPSQMLESLTPNAGNSKDQALSQEVNAPVPSASSSATVLPQSEQSSTIGASEPSEHPLVSSSATSVDHAAIVSRSKHVDSKGPTFGTNNSSSTSFMFSGSSLTRRVSIDAYAPRHRRIVETMLTLCGGKTHIGVTRRELFATLQGNTSVGAIRQTLPKLISKAMEEGVLEGFMDDQKEICFFLRNPVLMSTKKTSSTTWFPSMEFRR